MNHNLIVGDVIESLRSLPDSSVRMCVTSPPYFGLRDYDIEPSMWGDGWIGCLGNEPTPEQYIDHIVEVFREVRRVLTDDGTLWLNLGDSYAGSGKGPTTAASTLAGARNFSEDLKVVRRTQQLRQGFVNRAQTWPGIKAKDLIGIPWMAAFALRADGWYLRQDIIWAKPNPMPESVSDRCTRSHEYLFMLSKSRRYHYDHVAIKEPLVSAGDARNRADYKPKRARNVGGRTDGLTSASGAMSFPKDGRNKRDVWTVAGSSYKGAHFATFPLKLVEPCILAGSAAGDTILDPFGGSGTTSLAAEQAGRNSIYIDRSAAYAELARERLDTIQPVVA